MATLSCYLGFWTPGCSKYRGKLRMEFSFQPLKSLHISLLKLSNFDKQVQVPCVSIRSFSGWGGYGVLSFNSLRQILFICLPYKLLKSALSWTSQCPQKPHPNWLSRLLFWEIQWCRWTLDPRTWRDFPTECFCSSVMLKDHFGDIILWPNCISLPPKRKIEAER